MKKQKLKIDILEAVKSNLRSEKSNLQSEKNILEAEKKTIEVRFEVGIQIFENSILILFGKQISWQYSTRSIFYQQYLNMLLL